MSTVGGEDPVEESGFDDVVDTGLAELFAAEQAGGGGR